MGNGKPSQKDRAQSTFRAVGPVIIESTYGERCQQHYQTNFVSRTGATSWQVQYWCFKYKHLWRCAS
jgi:hypothetical protein